MNNPSEFLMDLSEDYSKGVLEKAGKFHCIIDALIVHFWDMHPVAQIMLR